MEVDFLYVKLNQVYRQTDNEYRNIVNAVRTGRIFHNSEVSLYQLCLGGVFSGHMIASKLDLLNERCVKQPGDNAIYLCCRKDSAAYLNGLALNQIPGEIIVSKAQKSGIFPENEYPTEEELRFKVGAKVMLLANKKNSLGKFDYVNGSTGTIVGFKPSNYQDIPKVMIHLDSGKRVIVGPSYWDHYRYELTEDKLDITTHNVGRFYQLPITLAYASTIHKAQGQTIRNNVHLVLERGCFTSGQLYVALSRIQSMNQLTLDRPIEPYEVIIEPKVIEFYKGLKPVTENPVFDPTIPSF